MGAVRVPGSRLWGAQTQRCLDCFKIGSQRMPFPVPQGQVSHVTLHRRGESSHYPLRAVGRWAAPLFTARLTVMRLTPKCSAIASMLYMPVPYASASARSLSL
jgi:hypothetical protein